MKILLLGTKATAANNAAYYQDYLDFFEKAITYSEQPLEVGYAIFDDLIITVGDGDFSILDTRGGHDLKEYGMILLRGHVREHFDVVKAVSIYVKSYGVPVLNDYSTFRSSSKLIQAVQFHELSVPVARTIFVTPAVLRMASAFPLGFPCIMKATYGSHGNHNYLVKDLEDIVRRQAENPGHEFVLQRYVPNDCDYRVLLIGSEFMIIKRTAGVGSHLNNTSRGGTAELIDGASLPPVIIEQSRRVARKLGMTIAGVDVLYDSVTGTYVFLEINSQPQLMTGACVDEKAKLLGAYLRTAARLGSDGQEVARSHDA